MDSTGPATRFWRTPPSEPQSHMHAHRSSRPWRSLALALAVVLSSFITLLVVAPTAAAVTFVSGSIASNTVWGIDGSPPDDDTYVLTADVTVDPGVTLTILAGTRVLFDPLVTLFVEGTLIAEGDVANPIRFAANDSANLFPPRAIEFQPDSSGSVMYCTFDRFLTAVIADRSDPSIQFNTVDAALIGFDLEQSSSLVWSNTVQRASIGILVSASDAYVGGNVLNGTDTGIEVLTSGSPVLDGNTITNVTSAFAVGILAGAGTSPAIRSNQISRVMGTNGLSPIAPGADGTDGGFAFGIFLDSVASTVVEGNVVDTVVGGNGGNGAGNASGTGGRGGNGGAGVGLLAVGAPVLDIRGNTFTNLLGGRGGRGGQSATTLTGGDGGDGGDVAGAYAINVAAVANVTLNVLDGVTGGPGGIGGTGTGLDGDGGSAGDAFGLLVGNVTDADVSGNSVTNVLGGFAGNSTLSGGGRGVGGKGGEAVGLMAFPAGAATLFHSNYVATVTGGEGGRGSSGGAGGNATGAFGLGASGGPVGEASATSNWIESVAGGEGGIGTRMGGNGGLSAGLSMVLIRATSASNMMWTIRGGDGGDAGDGTDGGRGGDATGFAVYLVSEATSTSDTIDTVTKGAVGTGPPAQVSYARGVFAAGNGTITSALTIENVTLLAVGDLDLTAEGYADVTTIATPFDGTAISVRPAGNLTVKNYLQVDAFWPDGTTPVAGASVLVEDNGSAVWNATAASGSQAWILATDRVYAGSSTATDNVTDVTVSYGAYGFQNNPRSVDLNVPVTESFVMIDTDAPASAADTLPKYTTTSTFAVSYTASDGTGLGLQNITLWYRRDAGLWTEYGSQAAAPMDSFLFTAPSDGTYEFATVANDTAGNEELLPAGNDTWTIVDTVRPGSHVDTLPTYETTASFLVSWEPDPGVSDVASYTIQYNRGSGWLNWLIGTTLTSQTFPASPAAGVYQFRSIAVDAAGNVEVVAGNDTWTIVDVSAPFSRVLALPAYQTSLTFTVAWGPQFDTFDIATYRIQVRDNGGAWTDWVPSTASTSADFPGADGHRYEFRSSATDNAGNVESLPSGNDTWTVVDVSLPDSLVGSLPAYTRTLAVPLSWGPAPGTTDVATYTIEASDNGGPWTSIPGYVGTTATSGSFAGQDGHRYAFRSIARDFAGNLETAPAGNDTWTIVDVTPPASTSSLSGAPGTNGWYESAVSVTLTSTDGTSGIASISYRIDGASWQTYSGAFLVTSDGAHTLEYYATDGAGNPEWTRTQDVWIDTVAPATTPTLSGTQGSAGWHLSSVVVTLAASDGTSGVDAIAYRVDGGSWQTYTGPFVVAGDGTHDVEYYARDEAGLVEVVGTASANVDTMRPFASAGAPRGTGASTTPSITITFSEAMDRAAVEQAFSITPDMNGVFTWSSDSRVLTFTPERPLENGRDYVVFIDSSARDAAGNTMALPYTFSFTTSGAPLVGGSLMDAWWLFLAIGATAGAIFLVVWRRRQAGRTKPSASQTAPAAKDDGQAIIEDVFLLYHRDGILIKHETRRLRPDVDSDILSGMLTAVQQFVKDALRGDDYAELNEMTVGHMHILIGRGKWLVLAARIEGDGTATWTRQIERCIKDMEDHHWDQLEDWDGDMNLSRLLAPYVKKLIRGEYV